MRHSCSMCTRTLPVKMTYELRSNWEEFCAQMRPSGIGGVVAHSPLPHNRTCGSASGGSAGGATGDSELGKSERGKVSIRQSEFQRRSVRKVPRSIGATRGLRGVLRTDAALAEFPVSRGASFPLFPDHRPKSTSDPFLQLA